VNGRDEYFTIPLKKDSDYLHVDERKLADTFPAEKIKLLRKITGSYKKAPHFESVFPLLQAIINQEEENLFRFIYQSLISVCEYLNIKTELVISSTIPIDHELKSQEKVIAICKAMGATQYFNPIGGTELYSKEVFDKNNIGLNFIRSNPIEYQQFKNEFVPWLSIIDVLMFNSTEEIREYLQSGYTII